MPKDHYRNRPVPQSKSHSTAFPSLSKDFLEKPPRSLLGKIKPRLRCAARSPRIFLRTSFLLDKQPPGVCIFLPAILSVLQTCLTRIFFESSLILKAGSQCTFLPAGRDLCADRSTFLPAGREGPGSKHVSLSLGWKRGNKALIPPEIDGRRRGRFDLPTHQLFLRSRSAAVSVHVLLLSQTLFLRSRVAAVSDVVPMFTFCCCLRRCSFKETFHDTSL